MIFGERGIYETIGIGKVFALVCSGCPCRIVLRSLTPINLGYASGTYNDISHGPVGKVSLGGQDLAPARLVLALAPGGLR